MQEETYRNLARRLDEIPNGFPASQNKVELQLLAKLFSPEEAGLASLMSLTPETADAIGERAGIDPKQAFQILKGMAAKGLIGFRRGDSQVAFHLIPFVVGFYENQLPRIDTEMATLVEQYFLETGGAFLREGPALHRVIPVGEAIPFKLEIFPYEHASQILEGAKSWGVRDCICRVQQHLVGKGCDHPVEVCLTFAPFEGAFDHSEVDRAITKDEALRILHQAEEAGLVHSTGNYIKGTSYICNCCTCCCGILRGISEFDIPTAVARSNFYTVVDEELCNGCGECPDRCPFGALAVPDYTAEIDYGRCVGCGLCASACSLEALHLERRPAEEVLLPPADHRDWMAKRSRERGLAAI
jgi:electron transport complex protein RnfB